MNARHRYCRRRGFTLVELLVVITVLGLLMGMLVFALQGANEQARVDRTRSQVARVHELLMDRWDQYHARPVPMRPASNAPQAAAAHRLYAVWELMRMELPERKNDVIKDAAYLKNPDGSVYKPSLWLAYRRKAEACCGPNWDTAWTNDFQDAECLYLILSTLRDGDSNALDFFTSREVGDVDGDGMPELLDGWGRPIRFLRWAPGFKSTMQECDPSTQPDPFDPLRTNPSGFALFPLVYSAGQDGKYFIRMDIRDDGTGASSVDYAAQLNNPYFSTSANPALGAFGWPDGAETDSQKQSRYPVNEGWHDNITNHFIVVR